MQSKLIKIKATEETSYVYSKEEVQVINSDLIRGINGSTITYRHKGIASDEDVDIEFSQYDVDNSSFSYSENEIIPITEILGKNTNLKLNVNQVYLKNIIRVRPYGSGSRVEFINNTIDSVSEVKYVFARETVEQIFDFQLRSNIIKPSCSTLEETEYIIKLNGVTVNTFSLPTLQDNTIQINLTGSQPPVPLP